MATSSAMARSNSRRSAHCVAMSTRKRRAFGWAAAKPWASLKACGASTANPYSNTRIAASSDRGARFNAALAALKARGASPAARARSATAMCAGSVSRALLSCKTLIKIESPARLSGTRPKIAIACPIAAVLSVASSIFLRKAVVKPLV